MPAVGISRWCSPSISRNFFVEAVNSSFKERWRHLFDLAWAGKGLTIDISKAPDHVLEWLVEWTNEANKREAEELRRQ